MPNRPSEPLVITWLRALHGHGGVRISIIVTSMAVVASAALTALFLSLADFPPREFRIGIVISVIVPLLIGPPITVTCTRLADHLLQLEAGLQDLAMRDPLTGVPNRRWILEQGADGVRPRSEPRACCALLMIDVDRFKSINDRFGHAAGDAVLCAVAVSLTRSLRPTERLGRIGGEEFLVLTDDRSPADLAGSGERLRRAVSEGTAGVAAPGHRVTASIGGTLLSSQGGPGRLASALKAADAALYRAKTSGRDRVEIVDLRDGPAQAPTPAQAIEPGGVRATASV